jgi:hypothetical protein
LLSDDEPLGKIADQKSGSAKCRGPNTFAWMGSRVSEEVAMRAKQNLPPACSMPLVFPWTQRSDGICRAFRRPPSRIRLANLAKRDVLG